MRRLTVLLILIASLAAGMHSPAQAGARPLRASSLAAVDPDSLVAAQQVAERIESRLRDSADVSFGGLRITDDGAVEVGIAGTPTAQLTAEMRATSGIVVRTRSVSHSYASLVDLTRKIDIAAERLRENGVDLSTWGPAVEENAVVIHLREYTKARADQLAKEFGGEAIEVASDSVDASAASRTADTAPWWGGSVVSATLTCTSGYGVNSSTQTQYFISAAHCGYTTNQVYYQNGATFGTVKSFMWGGANADAVLIRTPGGNTNTVFADPGANYRNVSAVASSDPVGGLICSDGAVSKEVCNVRIDATGQTVTYNGHTVHNLVRTHALGGQLIYYPGNSGGPVYTVLSGGSVNARGLVSAYLSTGGVPQYDEGWYSAIRYITSNLGVTVRTS